MSAPVIQQCPTCWAYPGVDPGLGVVTGCRSCEGSGLLSVFGDGTYTPARRVPVDPADDNPRDERSEP